MTAQAPDDVLVTSHEESSLFAGRYFFHLTDDRQTLTDDTGIEVRSISDARAQALKAIDELRAEDDLATEDWEGWRLEVADQFGTIVFAITLVDLSVVSYPKSRTASARRLRH